MNVERPYPDPREWNESELIEASNALRNAMTQQSPHWADALRHVLTVARDRALDEQKNGSVATEEGREKISRAHGEREALDKLLASPDFGLFALFGKLIEELRKQNA